ncbi:MAG: transcription termination factor Rho [Chthoniobacterales bacterium]
MTETELSTEPQEQDQQETPPPRPQETVSLQDLHKLSHAELLQRANDLGIRPRLNSNKFHLALDQARFHLAQDDILLAEGILEMQGQHGHLRWEESNFKPCADDVHLLPSLIRRYSLQPGLKVKCRVSRQLDRDRNLVADDIVTIEGEKMDAWDPNRPFDKLTPIFPNRRLVLENSGSLDISTRAVDLVAPLGMGQRGLIVAPPRAGKTMMLKAIARGIRKNHPEVNLILLLVDERPEEVTDMRRELSADVFSSTFDENVSRHVQVCEMVSDRSQRLVEMGKDVVILIDSLTRMARGYNNLQPNKGRAMSGGVDSRALLKPRKFFGSARNVEEGGSLTIIATVLVETQSRMDDLIFEEFKGTGNMELHLDRSIAEQRIFPAIQIIKSGTRREEKLYHPDEMHRIATLRRQLAELPAIEAMTLLSKNLQATDSNAELLMRGLKGT